MRYCSRCRNIIKDGETFCSRCGSTQFVENGKIETRGTANKLLAKLVQGGILKVSREATGRSPAIYAFMDLLNIVA